MHKQVGVFRGVLLLGFWVWGAGFAQTLMPTTPQEGEAAALFERHCASCHGQTRLGGTGPALLPESLERLRRSEAVAVIQSGRVATQMSGFGEVLKPDQIEALVKWIYTPVVPSPAWQEADIRASRIQHADAATLPNKPGFEADPMNLFVVVESGDHHVSLLDGDKLAPIARFPSRYALHGGPKFSPEGRFVYFASRDGWISRYDLWNRTLISEVRAGLNTRNVAVSGDGRFVVAANYLPNTLAIFDADLKLIKTVAVTTRDGKTPSRVSAVYDATPRKSFVLALKDIPEIWEMSYDEHAAPVLEGYVHDHRMMEAVAEPGFLTPRRTLLSTVLDDFFFTQDYRYVMGASREGAGQVINLDIRRKVAELPLSGMPHLGSGMTFEREGRTLMASTNLKVGAVTVIDMADWQVVKQIPTRGPGFFIRSHEKSRYAFVDAMMSQESKNILQVIDKQTLEVVKELKVAPGQTLAHVEFTRDGRYALASLWEQDGAIIVYDAQTLEEVKRLPMKKPVGKYNLWNKLTRSEGTSH